ncbi:MAG: glutathione S-transferase family protein [Pseudomonadota bacterium]
MSEIYTLYGSYASYYTAKVRAYLRKKGIAFEERLPSDPLFRNKVRPSSGSHRIPQLLAPQGEVIQDSVEIVDFLEPRFPQLPAFPDTPRQRIFVHLLELFGSEGLVRLAWMHRWLFEDNDFFVKMDFGRSFKPQGDDAELDKYGNLIAQRMRSYGLPASTPQARAMLDEQYRALLALFERRLIEHPYFLGGHPSAADYAVMGAMHAHLGRDPAGLRTMQDHAPRTFRWVEHMLVPEVVSPEFFSVPVAYPADDLVPQTSLDILNFIAAEFGEALVLSCFAFDQAMERLAPEPGHVIDADHDQPTLPVEQVELDGVVHECRANLHGVWLAQRAQSYFRAQSDDARAAILDMVGQGHARALLEAPLRYSLQRVQNRLALAAVPGSDRSS